MAVNVGALPDDDPIRARPDDRVDHAERPSPHRSRERGGDDRDRTDIANRPTERQGGESEQGAHGYALRRLDAEVLIDALYLITGTSETLS